MKRFLLAVLIALPILAEAQHRVSRIEVNSAVPSRILLSQSTLVEGRSYTDADLEVAVARLRRLPFVYDARYRLDGETLILDVQAMTRIFGELDAAGAGFENDQTGSAELTGGGRLFVGSGGVAQITAREHVNEADDAQSLSAEYSQYGIGGSRFFATAAIGQVFTSADHVDVDPELRLTVGYPLTLRSTVTASLLTAGFESRRSFPLVSQPLVNEAEQRMLTLRYTWDTSDDPFFARRGLLVSGGPSYADEESRFETVFFIAPDQTVILRSATDATFTELAADAKAFLPFRERGTFFGILRAAYGHREFDTLTNGGFPFPGGEVIPLPGEVDTNDIALAVGYGHNLFDWNSPLGTTRQRLEFTLGAARSSFDQDDDFLPRSSSFDTKSATLAYVLRRQFATVRLNLSYTVD